MSRHVASAECRAAAREAATLIAGLRELHLRPDEIVAAPAGHRFAAPARVPGVSRRGRAIAGGQRGFREEPGGQTSRGPPDGGRRSRSRRWRRHSCCSRSGWCLAVQRKRRPSEAVLRRSSNPPATAEAGVPAFAWTAYPGATRYRLSVFSEDGRTVWSRETALPAARWPDDVPRVSGAYRWRVDALAGRMTVASSRVADVEIPR